MSTIFEPGEPIWNIALRTTLVYFGLLILLRLAGKREIGQITVFDVVVILTIANAVQNAMVGTDTSVTGGLVAAAVLVGLNAIVVLLGVRSFVFQKLIQGEPTILVSHGNFVTPNLRREGLDPDDVLMVMREHGIDSLEQVKLAVLETDGSISIVPTQATGVVRTRRNLRFLRRRD